MKSTNKIYYAHHMQKYNTLFEDYELKIIEKSFPQYEIINPNGDLLEEGTEEEIMQTCFSAIDFCNIFIFSTVCGNCVGKGVFREIMYAKKHNIPIFCLYGGEVRCIYDIELELLNSESERFYAKIKNLNI